ncbi:unnamed protein product [Leuciscus chuanchicus]
MRTDKETGPDGRQVNGGEVDRLIGKMEKEKCAGRGVLKDVWPLLSGPHLREELGLGRRSQLPPLSQSASRRSALPSMKQTFLDTVLITIITLCLGRCSWLRLRVSLFVAPYVNTLPGDLWAIIKSRLQDAC